MAQLMPLPLTVSCFIKTQIGITFLVPAHLGSLGKRAVKWVCVCVCVYFVLKYISFDWRLRAFVVLGLVFVHTEPRDWLWETSPK